MTAKRVIRRLVLLCGGPTTKSRLSHIQKLVTLSSGIFDETHIITEDMNPVVLSKSGRFTFSKSRDSLHFEKSTNFVQKLFDFMRKDLRKSKDILLKSSRGDAILCLGIYQPISMIAAWIKGSNLALFGGGFDVSNPNKSRGLLGRIWLSIRWAFQIAILHLVDMVIIESPSVATSYNLKKFQSKMFFNGHLYVSSKFSVCSKITSRKYDFAYIGALSEEKGICEFLETLKIIMGKRKTNALIVGSGQFYEQVKSDSWDDSRITVDHMQYVIHEKMPEILNQVKLLVMPSKSEGLPNILMESMSCGTPTLATPVGGIPDFVKDEDTGFLLLSNEPEYIADKILYLISNPEILEFVSTNASLLAKKKFNFSNTKTIWREIFIELSKH